MKELWEFCRKEINEPRWDVMCLMLSIKAKINTMLESKKTENERAVYIAS